MKVRVHLNLANPARAENVVKVKTDKGSWLTVAYATQMILKDCYPVVEALAQERIRTGASKKVPHAYIEGELVHFVGRLRPLAPKKTVDLARPFLKSMPEFEDVVQEMLETSEPINYNPRVARCFYLDEAGEKKQKFVSCPEMLVLGWSFRALSPQLVKMSKNDLCEKDDVLLTSLFERSVISRGHGTTSEIVDGIRRKNKP